MSAHPPAPDTRLIAAAPDLLRALKELLSAAEAYRRDAQERTGHTFRVSNEGTNVLSAYAQTARKLIAKVEAVS